MMELWLIPLIIWLLIGIVVVIVVGMMCVKLCWHLIIMNLEAHEHVKEIKKRTAEKYNKFVAMSQSELEEYLVKTYSLILELTCAKLISAKDPDAMDKLYGNSFSEMLKYLGQPTIDALDYYYGTKYIDRWCELRFKYLENTGIIHSLMERASSANTVKHALDDTITQATRK